ncbi:MAG: superoxide dismutase family protein [Chlamydiae bacterium]|nr:superoxide dismutase family protein [Chlamydiota bacterium]MBI3277039.1 superoxide dismutase family protein [Chlamydiota bacterium]
MKTIRLGALSLGAIFLSFVSLGRADSKTSSELTKAVAILHPTQGNQVKGMISFTKSSEGIWVVADIEGLTPGKHGFHIHEKGSCDSVDGSSAGGHFNPHQMPHAAPNDAQRHEGDLGNVMANEKGVAHLEYIDSKISLNGDDSIIGRSVILHAQEDDFKTQPTGNAGARIACGVIEVSE